MKLLKSAACLLAAQGGNGESTITDCNGRCRSGWAFGQGFDSPQVHILSNCEKRGNTVFMRVSAFFVFGINAVLDRFRPFWLKKVGYKRGYKMRNEE